MREVTGRILSWDEVSQQGVIEGDDGARYPFSAREWTEEGEPDVHEGVLNQSQGGNYIGQ